MTIYIIIITVIISVLAFQNEEIRDKVMFKPYMISTRNEWFRFVSSGFIHADWIHLFINMFVLYSFGNAVESYYGYVFPDHNSYYFILLYLGAIVISDLPTYKKHTHDPSYNGLGASGGVSAVLFASIIFNPWQKIYLYGIIGIPGIVAGVAYLAYSYYMDKKGGTNVNHGAHFWGAVYGFIFTIALKPSLGLFFIQKLIDF
jgi:membrane associated rhomboid family serine protease